MVACNKLASRFYLSLVVVVVAVVVVVVIVVVVVVVVDLDLNAMTWSLDLACKILSPNVAGLIVTYVSL